MFTLDYRNRPDSVTFLDHPRIKLAIRDQEASNAFEIINIEKKKYGIRKIHQKRIQTNLKIKNHN
jgi:hypothetical protein